MLFFCLVICVSYNSVIAYVFMFSHGFVYCLYVIIFGLVRLLCFDYFVEVQFCFYHSVFP